MNNEKPTMRKYRVGSQWTAFSSCVFKRHAAVYGLKINFIEYCQFYPESDSTFYFCISSKVSRSVSDVSELTSTATSLMSRKFDRFEEKRRQQLDKRTKAVKSIFRKSQSNKG